jgi:hypothetical protein
MLSSERRECPYNSILKYMLCFLYFKVLAYIYKQPHIYKFILSKTKVVHFKYYFLELHFTIAVGISYTVLFLEMHIIFVKAMSFSFFL